MKKITLSFKILNRNVSEFILKVIFLNFLVTLSPLLALWLGITSRLADHKDREIWMYSGLYFCHHCYLGLQRKCHFCFPDISKDFGSQFSPESCSSPGGRRLGLFPGPLNTCWRSLGGNQVPGFSGSRKTLFWWSLLDLPIQWTNKTSLAFRMDWDWQLCSSLDFVSLCLNR